MEGKRIIVSLFLPPSLRTNYSWNGRGTCCNAVYIVFPLSNRGIFFFFFFSIPLFCSTFTIFIDAKSHFSLRLLRWSSNEKYRRERERGRGGFFGEALPGNFPSGFCRIIIPDKRAPSRPIMLQSFATATQLFPGFSSGPVSLRKHSRERRKRIPFSSFFFQFKKRIL